MVDKARQMEILKKALEIETTEKSYYERAAASAENALAKQLFQRLSKAEDEHARRFTTIRAQLERSGEWPDVGDSWQDQKLGAILEGVSSAAPAEVEVARSELDAMKDAMGKEIEAYDMYKSRAKEATVAPEKKFYDTLAGEERIHHLALLDAYEFLTDPAGWYTVKEKWTIEGNG
jgi:rubrerythrin